MMPIEVAVSVIGVGVSEGETVGVGGGLFTAEHAVTKNDKMTIAIIIAGIFFCIVDFLNVLELAAQRCALPVATAP